MGAIISKRLNLDSIGEDDIIIAIVGGPGTGKSTFINAAAGKELLAISNSLRPSPSDIQHVACSNPEHGSHRTVFIEIPSFDSEREEGISRRKLERWLRTFSSGKLKISGVLCLQRITDSRSLESPVDRLSMFRKLCEESSQGFPRRVVLVTTMWGKLKSLAIGAIREKELQQLWDTLPGRSEGYQVMRFENSFDSAWAIVSALMDRDSEARN